LMYFPYVRLLSEYTEGEGRKSTSEGMFSEEECL